MNANIYWNTFLRMYLIFNCRLVLATRLKFYLMYVFESVYYSKTLQLDDKFKSLPTREVRMLCCRHCVDLN